MLVALVLFVAGCGGGAGTTSCQARPSSDPRSLVLTTGDLARGYQYGDDTVCGRPDASEGRDDLPPELRSTRSHTHNALDDAIEQADIFNRLFEWPGRSQ